MRLEKVGDALPFNELADEEQLNKITRVFCSVALTVIDNVWRYGEFLYRVLSS